VRSRVGALVFDKVLASSDYNPHFSIYYYICQTEFSIKGSVGSVIICVSARSTTTRVQLATVITDETLYFITPA
jgi:hypothetical protein